MWLGALAPNASSTQASISHFLFNRNHTCNGRLANTICTLLCGDAMRQRTHHGDGAVLCCAVAAVQVMEPNIMDRLREYVMANGHPQQAVEYLTDSYVGASGLVVVGA